MPKKVFKLPSFDKGLVVNASPRDIPEDAMSYGENVDSRVRGRVQGIKGNDDVDDTNDVSGEPFGARVMTAVLGNDNILIGQRSDGTFSIYNIDNGDVTFSSTESDFARTIITNNMGGIISMTTGFRSGNPAPPKVITDIDNAPFGGTSGDNRIEDAECKSFADNPIVKLYKRNSGDNVAEFRGTDSEIFDPEKRYFWAISIIYDGYMESPLIFGDSPGEYWGEDASGSTTSYADLQVVVDGTLPKRATGINIYRAESPDGGDEPLSEYRLVKYIDTLQKNSTPESYKTVDVTTSSTDSGDTVLTVNDGDHFVEGYKIKIGSDEREIVSVNDSTPSITLDSGVSSDYSSGEDIKVGFDHWWNIDGTITGDHYYLFRDGGSQGATYQDNTGVPETLESTSVDYKIATDYSGYLFVGGCAKDGIDDAAKYIFRSKPKTYSIIDWSQDFVILPEEPTALIGFGGRLYAFGSANMYRINPISMSIEDTYAGVGALNENMVVATNYGMFHADDNNIYHNDGTVSQPIGDSILTLQDGSGMGWQELNKTDSSDEHYASMAFDPINKRLLLFAESSGSDTVCWAYDVMRERWDLYTDFDMPSDTAVGPNGKLYATTGDTTAGFDLKTLFTSSTRKNWKVRTKDFDLGSDSGDFYGYDLQGFGEGDFTIKYAKDGGSFTSPGTSTEDGLRKATVSSADKKMKSIQLQVESASGSDSLDNLTVQFRPQVIQE